MAVWSICVLNREGVSEGPLAYRKKTLTGIVIAKRHSTDDVCSGLDDGFNFIFETVNSMTNARNHSIRPRSTVRVLLLFVGLLRADGIFGGEPAARQLSQFVSQPSENVSLGDDVSPVVEGGVDYLRDIKPLLTENCYACHGALKTQSGLRLDTVALMKKGGDSGSAIAPNDPLGSLLFQRIVTGDLTERMPPESDGEPLTAEQTERIRKWIAAGARGTDDEKPERDASQHWSFQPRVRPNLPHVDEQTWSRTPIDALIGNEHQRLGLKAQPEASRALLIRRLYLDLIGIPPTPSELHEQQTCSSIEWYERLVDQLLADPRHSERWARHWMDIWRYSDGSGLGGQLRNSHTHLWHWRDWVVESLNEDLPYDEMVRLMIAADELHPNDLSRLRATGYLARNYNRFSRTQWIEETVEHLGKGFVGLTFNCAKCHDHKYDPIEQTEYYRMRAIFEPSLIRVDVLPEEPNTERNGIPRIYDASLTVPTYRYVRGQENNPDKAVVILPGVPQVFGFSAFQTHPVSLPIESREPERRSWVIENHLAVARKAVATAEATIADLEKKLTPVDDPQKQVDRTDLSIAQFWAAVAKAELTSIELRAEAARASWACEAVSDLEKDSATATARMKAFNASRSERELAVAKARHRLATLEQEFGHAVEDKKEPLEKKVVEEREQLEKLVQGLESASDKFTPFSGTVRVGTHFISNNAPDPVEDFHATSTGRRSALARWITDPTNPLAARVATNHLWSRHFGVPLVTTLFDFGRKGRPPSHPELLDWLASELVDHGWSMKHLHRAIVTSATYRMSSSLSGGSETAQKDPDNRYYWRRTTIRLEAQVVRDSIVALTDQIDLTRGGPSVRPDDQAHSKRRSLYFLHSNNERNLFLTTFDDAGTQECYRRDESIVPQQALALSNSLLVQDASSRIAERLSDLTTNARGNDETTFVKALFAAALASEPTPQELAVCTKALAAWRSLPDVMSDPHPELRSRSNLVRTLLNDNDFVTLR